MGIIIVIVAIFPFPLLARIPLKKHCGSWMDPGAIDTLALVAGLGYVALVMFALGVLQLYDSRVVWGIVALHYVFLVPLYGKGLASRLGQTIGRLLIAFRAASSLHKWLVLFAAFLVLCNVAGAAIPQTGDDALCYHFALPKLFIQHGGLYFYPYSFMSAWPFNIEMLFTFGMLLHNDTVANLLNVIVGITCTLMIYHLVKAYLGHTQGLLWAVIAYSTPLTLTQAHKGFVDLGTGMFALSGLYLLLIAIQKNRLNATLAMVSGIFFGLAAGSKVMGALTGMCVSLALWCCFFRVYGKRILLYSGLIVFFTGLIASPWYLRSALHTGNPVYPALYSVFGGKYWNDAVEQRLQNLVNSPDITLVPLGRSLQGLVAAPFFLHYPALVGEWFVREQDGGRPPSTARPLFGYLSLIFLPFGCLFLRKRQRLRREVAFMAVTSLLFLLAWFFCLTQEDRYLTPLLGMLYLFSACGLQWIVEDWHSPWLRRVSVGACALWFCASLGAHALYYVPKAYGIAHREAYLGQFSYLHTAITWTNAHLGPHHTIAILSDVPLYYLDIPYIHIGPAFHLFDYTDGASLRDFFRSKQVTHLFVTQDLSGHYLYTDPRAANPMIYLFRSDAPSYRSEMARSQSADPIHALLSDPLQTTLVYDRVEAPVIAKTPLVLGDPIRVRVYELAEAPQ